MLDEYSFKLPIRARFRDSDMLGHINNAVYLTYFESGRIEYWMVLTGNSSLEGLPFILAQTEIDFLAEARAGEDFTLGVRAVRLGNKSFDLEYLLVRDVDGKPVAQGRSVQVMFDYESRRTQLLDTKTRQMIDKFESANGTV